MFIQAISNYYDIQRKTDVKAGDVYEVATERGRQIIAARYAVECVVTQVETPVEEQDVESEEIEQESAPDAVVEETEVTKPKRVRKRKTSD